MLSIKKFRPFILSLLISLAVFGLMLFGFFKLLNSQVYSDITQVDFNQSSVYIPTENDCMNILVIACPAKNLTAENFILLRFDALANKCYVSAIPQDVKTTVNVKTMTLPEHYDYGGTKTAVSAVENMFLINIDRYIRIDKYNIKALVEYFGNIEYEFQADIKTSEFEFKQGSTALDGARVASLMLEADIDIGAELIKEYISLNFNAQTHANISAFAQTLFDNCDTSVTKFDFSNYSKPIDAFFKNSNDKVEQIKIATQTDEIDNAVTIVQTSINLMKKTYNSYN